jgi:single-strand DNA-binding protein
MMNTPVNQVHLVGSLTQLPTIELQENGDKLARFALSTNEYAQSIHGKIEKKKQWHKILAKNKWALILEEFAEKGQQLAIEGKLSTHFSKSKSGKKYATTVIEVNDLILLSRTEPLFKTFDASF